MTCISTGRQIALCLSIALALTIGGCGGGGGGDAATRETTIPSLFGLSLADARAQLVAADLVIGKVTTRPQVTDPAVIVLAQDPIATTTVRAGSFVSLTVSLPGDAGKFLVPDLFAGLTGSDNTTSAYYRAVDPTDAASTLTKWKALNRFGQPGGEEASAIYQNDVDLGFGRRMFMRREGSRVAFYVENFGSLQSAIDIQGLVATVAMEYSPGPAGADPTVSYTKFYIFDANGNRVNKINLDGEGDKFVPNVCLSCHGGRPGNAKSGVYPRFGNVDAQFIPFDLASFLFSDAPGLSRADQESKYKQFNVGIRETHARSFSYTGAPVAIPDNDATGIDVPLDVAGLERLVNHIDVTFDAGGIEHPSLADLEVTLVSPTGQQIRLLERTPFSGWETELAHEISLVTNELNRGMDVDANGNILVVTYVGGSDGMVRSIDPDTGALTTITSGGLLSFPTFPSDLSIAPNGDIFVVESNAGIVRIDPDSGLQTSVPAGLAPSNIVVASDGFLLVRVGTAIHRVHPTTGANSVYAQGDKLDSPQGIVLDTAGNLYVADFGADTIIRIDAATQAQTYWRPTGTYNNPTRVAVDPKGRVVVGDQDGLTVFDSGTEQQTSISGSGASFLAIDSAGVVFSMAPDSKNELMRVGPFAVVNLKQTVLEDTASEPLRGSIATKAPFPGSYAPFAPLSTLRNANPNGRWILKVRDLAGGDVGRLVDFSLHFSDNPTSPPHPHPVEIIEGWYGGRAMAGRFNANFLPSGWTTPDAPADASELYHEVVARSCRLCHMQMPAWIDFSTYDGFIALGARHKQTVFDEGVMPLSKRTFNKFWMSEFPPNQPTNPPSDVAFVRNPEDANGVSPSQSKILAKFLAAHFDGSTSPTQGPGRPQASAGPDRLVDTQAVVELNGIASLFAATYEWTQISGQDVTLLDATNALPRFVAPNFNTDLTFRLTVRNASGVLSSQDDVNVKVESAATPATNLFYATDIHPIWASASCTGCHTAVSTVLDLTGDSVNTYARMTNRVNKADAVNSLILLKPTATIPHGGGLKLAKDSKAYKDILEWIKQGAKNN